MLQDYVLEKDGVIVYITPTSNRFGMKNGYASYTIHPEQNSDTFKAYYSNTGNKDYTPEHLERLIWSEVTKYGQQGYRDIKSPNDKTVTSVIFNNDGSLLSFSNGGPHIAQSTFEDELKGIDADVDYIILKDNLDGTIVVENKYGEPITCRNELFRLNLAALGVKMVA